MSRRGEPKDVLTQPFAFNLDSNEQYDVKKIEEVVYDISLRGLVKGEDRLEEGGVAFPLGSEAQQRLVDLLAQDL